MSREIKLKLSDKNYRLFKILAKQENKTIANYIETAARCYVENDIFVEKSEMAEIRNSIDLNKSIKRALTDVKKGRVSLFLE